MTTGASGEFGPEQMAQLEALAPAHAKIVRATMSQAKPKASGKAKAAPKVDVAQLTIDLEHFLERLTVGDLEDIERATGVPALAMSFFGGSRSSVSGTAALVWVLRRKDDPRYTYKMAREIPVEDLMAAMNAMSAPVPEGEDGQAELDAVADPLGGSALPSA